MVIKDESYQETYTKAKKIAPHINELLREETPATRAAIEQEARGLMQAYEPGKVYVNNAVAGIAGVFLLASPMYIMALGQLERAGFREHTHLLALGGLGLVGLIATSYLSNRDLTRLYRAYAYVQRQNGDWQEKH